MPTIFWAWQSDLPHRTNRNVIWRALTAAVKTINVDRNAQNQIEVDTATRNMIGSGSIPDAILRKIDEAAIIVADVTPVVEGERGRPIPNPNVLFEYGYATARLGETGLIPILNTGSGFKPDDLPFDIKHKRAMDFDCADDGDADTRRRARNNLQTQLENALSSMLAHKEKTAAQALSIEGLPAAPDNPSIWDAEDYNFELPGPGGSTKYRTPNQPRAYLRVIPKDWPKGAPTVAEMCNADFYQLPNVTLGAASDGDYGSFEFGYLTLMRTGHRDSETRTVEAGNIAAWMEDTGEFWLLHGTAIVQHGANTFLPFERFVAEWREGLARAMRLLDQFGANAVRRVEAGVHDIKGVRSAGHGRIEAAKARRNQATHSQTLALWDEQAQSNFLMEATNKIHNLFAQPHIKSDEWAAFLSQCRK